MCGIVGFWHLSEIHSKSELIHLSKNMADTLIHRGPDFGNCWVDEKSGLALAHRRLSILDLSPEGNQPMISKSGRFVIVLNGEIYNFLTLRDALIKLGHVFNGHSDTEVALAAFEEWGIIESLKKFIGMFAFAVWDTKEKTLTLARDRIGEKPLYFGFLKNKTFVFASELKALRKHPYWTGTIDRQALAKYLRYAYVPAPWSIYQGIRKLMPGYYLFVAQQNGNWIENEQPYWSVTSIVKDGFENPFSNSETELISSLENLLLDAVKQQMISDVPLGAFLSGGVDSSTVVALMQAQSNQPVKTFTIGFWEKEYNEAQHAKEVAKYLGTNHTELYVTPNEAKAVIPLLPEIYDEPFADSSQIPTYLVAQLARRHVTVSLSGDAGDELFGGYNRYFLGEKIWRGISWLPIKIRKVVGNKIASLPILKLSKFFQKFEHLLPEVFQQRLYADKLLKLSEILKSNFPLEIFLSLITLWKQPSELLEGVTEPEDNILKQVKNPLLPDFVSMMMFLDLISYLPDDILVKVDRACMRVSLESRVPFLDHRVVEFAWRLPLKFKIRNGCGKWIIRKILYKYVPQKLIDRPKMGFGIPIDHWLRSSLREWAEDLLSESLLKQEGYFVSEPIRKKWNEHLSGKRNWQHLLWCILMFQAWLEKQKLSC